MDIDKENTMRALKDEPLIIKLRCRLGIHRWTVWREDPTVGKKREYAHDYITIAYRSDCVLCNQPRWMKVLKPDLQ